MFEKLLGGLKSRKAAQNPKERQIFESVTNRLWTVLNDKSQGIGQHWSEGGKQKLVSDIIADISRGLSAPNPIQAVRMRTIEFMILSAKFDVLIMQKPTPFFYLSGELKERIPELAQADKELEEFFSELGEAPTSFEKMWDSILAKYWVMHLYMNTYNIVRQILKDSDDSGKKDWFQPCYISLCVWQENKYRQELGLPLTIEGDAADLKAICHSSWIWKAEEGHKNLRMVWERAWEEAFHEPSPYANFS
jgi:hypothetical protein